MAKKKQNKLIKWITVAVIAVVLLAVIVLLKNNVLQPQQQETGYSVYQSLVFGFSIDYPTTWEVKQDTQVFENGDAVAFRKTGPGQKVQTELTDGAQVVVSQPFSINVDLAVWVKESYPNTSVFSQNTISGRTYQKVYTCDLGCMTFYYTLINGKVYGVATFAEGPDSDKMVYENAIVYMLNSLQFTNATGEGMSKEQAITKVKALPEVIDYLKRVPNGLVLVNGEEDSSYMIQVYEVKDGHTATFNWYSVDKTTGEVKKQF